MADPALAEHSYITVGLAITALVGVVTALWSVFKDREATRKEMREEFVSKEVFKVTLEAINKGIEKVEHVHDCIHRMERKMDTVIERNRRKDNADE